MNKLMCRFVATTKKKKKKKIADPNLDTACPTGIPCNKMCFTRCLLHQTHALRTIKRHLSASDAVRLIRYYCKTVPIAFVTRFCVEMSPIGSNICTVTDNLQARRVQVGHKGSRISFLFFTDKFERKETRQLKFVLKY